MRIFEYLFMQRAFVVGILLAAVVPCVGMVVVCKRLSMIGDALSHTSLAGVAAGLLLGVNPVAGAAAACVAASFGIEAIRRKLPRYSEMSISIIMSAGIGLAGVLSGFVKNSANFNSFLFGSIVAIIFGVILLCTYFSVVIYYDDEGFLYKAWGHGKKEFRYSQIKGQRSLLTRGGVNTILFVGNEEINLYSAMQNLNAFLSKAFFKWCAVKGIDPDTIENNPRMATYFPDPDDVSAQG